MKRNQHIADLGPLLAAQGIRHVVICPGSRNAPLIQMFTGNPSFCCHSIVDERSAAYLALGMASRLQKPVAVVTTSGTAVLNLAPAVAEAQNQRIPIILFTADRPRESVPQFNNQIIDQCEPFARNSKGFLQLPEETADPSALEKMLREVESMIRRACIPPKGPVHFNVTLEEPLYDPLPEPYFGHFRSREKDPFPDANQESFGEKDQASFGEKDQASFKKIPGGDRVLVLAGMGPHDRKVCGLLERLSEMHQAVVVAENIANLPSGRFIANPELLLHAARNDEMEALVPDVVIAFGGQVVSKRLKLFLDEHPPREIRILEKDPAAAIQNMLEADLAGDMAGGDYYPETWRGIGKRALNKAAGYLKGAPFCNLTAIHRALSTVPAKTVIHAGNSSVIRYSQLLPRRSDLRYLANRGTSGIDGTVSSAVGAAMVSEELHLLVVGDLGFVYDSNALWNKDFPDNLRILVVNDGGGGIFRLLEGPERMPFFEEFSVTHHPVSLDLLTRSFGRKVRRAAGLEELEEELASLFRTGADTTVLEADTSGSENSRIFKEFLNHLQS
ncbi:MAG: 2-succinyl-5-enolpyruvyl-6-hydroxy-3-cyclohexene-1-carboxylic-acid synthase [Bacteroidales bacterium]